MTAAWPWGRSELRARWRSWVVLGLLAGAPLALVALLLVIPAAILVANVLAAVPARSAARIRPAEALRTE